MMQFPFMNINARRGGVGPHGFLGVNPASARGFLHAGGAQGMGGHNVANQQVGMGGGATGGFGSSMQSGVGGSRGNVSMPGIGGFGGGAGFGGAMGGGSQPRRMVFVAGRRDVMPPRGGSQFPIQGLGQGMPPVGGGFQDRIHGGAGGMGGGMMGGGVMGKQWNNMGGGMGGFGGGGMGGGGMGGFDITGQWNPNQPAGAISATGGGMGIAQPPGRGGSGGVSGIRRGEWDNVPQPPVQRRPQGGGVIMEDPAPRRRRRRPGGGAGGGRGGHDITGQWNPNQPAGVWSARGQGGGMGSMGGGMPGMGGAMGSPMGGGMMGGMGGAMGRSDGFGAGGVGNQPRQRNWGNDIDQGFRPGRTGAEAAAETAGGYQSRTAVGAGNQQGTVGGAFNNQPSAESDMSDSPDVGGGMGTARAGGGFNRRPPQNFGPTGGFRTETRTQDLGSPMGSGGGTGDDGRPVGGGPIGGGPIGPQPSPISPTPQPSPISPTPPRTTPPSYGGGFGMMSPYGGQQPQINQDFSFSSNMYGQNPMMQMAQKQPKVRQFAPRQGRSQSRTIGNLANLARQRRNLRFGWG